MEKISKEDYGVCSVCGESEYEVMKHSELHHVDSRKESDFKTRLCPNCHYRVTEEQNKLPPKTRNAKSEIDKIIMMLRSHGAITKHIGKKQIELSERLERSKDDRDSN